MAHSDSETPPGMPRWVKIFMLIVILLILLVIVIMLAVGGNHGPGRHAPGMLTGFALLAFRYGSRCQSPGGNTVANDDRQSEDYP